MYFTWTLGTAAVASIAVLSVIQQLHGLQHAQTQWERPGRPRQYLYGGG